MARCLRAAVLLVAFLMSNMVSAQPRGDVGDLVWHPRWGWPTASSPHRCLAWDGYQWLNMCYRSRTFVHPAWARFQR
jgi:hypothetical protein